MGDWLRRIRTYEEEDLTNWLKEINSKIVSGELEEDPLETPAPAPVPSDSPEPGARRRLRRATTESTDAEPPSRGRRLRSLAEIEEDRARQQRDAERLLRVPGRTATARAANRARRDVASERQATLTPYLEPRAG